MIREHMYIYIYIYALKQVKDFNKSNAIVKISLKKFFFNFNIFPNPCKCFSQLTYYEFFSVPI